MSTITRIRAELARHRASRWERRIERFEACAAGTFLVLGLIGLVLVLAGVRL